MAKITETVYYDGAEQKATRLGLKPLIDEVRQIIEGVEILVEERKNANSGAVLREMIDEGFDKAGNWAKKQTGDIDRKKCKVVNGTQVCLGVEVQVSARCDLIYKDIAHLRKQITDGNIDVGMLILPSDKLSFFLTDRAPALADGKRIVEESRATELPIILLGIEHDGAGPLLPKKKTNVGR